MPISRPARICHVPVGIPSHAGCASNAYADAAATAYMGASEIEDATSVIRGAVRTRPCLYTDRRRTAGGEWRGDVLDRRTYYATRGHTNEWVRGRLGEGLTAGSHTAGVPGPLWSDVVRGTTRHKWDTRQRIKDQHGEREIQFADVDDHVMGARVRQQAGVPHGAHHERIMQGEAGRETPGAATRSELRGCLVCKAARDAARRAALKRDPLCPIVRKAAQQWTEEDENPPRATMAHLLSGACLGNREQARWFLRVARAQTGTAISKVAQAAPDSKDTLKTLRIAHVAALKGSRYRVLDEDGYEALAPAVGGVLPALVDDLSEKSRRDLGAGVTRNLQVVAEAATGAVQRWIQFNDEATARIMKREEHIEWLRKLFAGWKEARPALRESRRRRDNRGNVGTGQQPVGRTRTVAFARGEASIQTRCMRHDSRQRVRELLAER
ncbi:hypothetical protein EMIHUDRAFT_233931 [Emiliania huxleyi CCMP1516]|uniref:Uncharacterized protein n=2 Tax=Emiliania huxleyi TaxID=2903 RepID=A0A0D3K1A6_EMIH1|nr:hypothetical protein EMIHUDRAFT_233931 [Emiliania huxleyi CCMP1516]EOD29541.1 hypothetical protein EMIHUDRAFT_233931 [Emiliania huxleyi CCMP1516]|eukprot:XP_005781970.1 hypothetical protein EMIHUDRAFT_233931 [Emiliania huxleyi CCMP1516]